MHAGAGPMARAFRARSQPACARMVSWSKGSALKGQAYVLRMGSCWPSAGRILPLLAAIAVSLWMLGTGRAAMADPASARATSRVARRHRHHLRHALARHRGRDRAGLRDRPGWRGPGAPSRRWAFLPFVTGQYRRNLAAGFLGMTSARCPTRTSEAGLRRLDGARLWREGPLEVRHRAP